jgi:hypothetical protein
MIERWKAEHPEHGGPARKAPAPRPRLVPPPPAPPAPQMSPDAQRAMIERWRNEHPELVGGRRPPVVAPAPAPSRPRVEDGRTIDIANTPLTVLAAFIIGCIIGGVAMTIITGIAFWGFSGA